MYRHLLTVAFVFALGCSASADAALRFDRSSTLTDTAGGTMTTRSNGSFAVGSGSAATESAFLNFAPRDGRGSVNGSMSRTRDRDGDLVTLRYDGNLSLNLPANGAQAARSVTVSFDDLAITRSEEGRTIEGSIVINGRAMPASEAPRSIIAILIGLTRLMRV